MHTEYGRAKVQAILESQDDTHVNIQFYFPNPDTVKDFEATISNQERSIIKDSETYLEEDKLKLEELLSYLKYEKDEEEIKNLNIEIGYLQKSIKDDDDGF